MADQAAEGPHTHGVGPHPRDAGMGTGSVPVEDYAQAAWDRWAVRREPLRTAGAILGTAPAASLSRGPGPSKDPGGQSAEKPERVSTQTSQAAEFTTTARDVDLGFICAALSTTPGTCTSSLPRGHHREFFSARGVRRPGELYQRCIPSTGHQGDFDNAGCDLIPGFALD